MAQDYVWLSDHGDMTSNTWDSLNTNNNEDVVDGNGVKLRASRNETVSFNMGPSSTEAAAIT